MPFVDVFHIAHAKDRIGRSGFVLLHVQNNVAPDHQPGDIFFCHVARVVNAHGAAVSHDGQPIGDFHDLVELVGNEDDGIALIFQVNELLEKLGRLLRGQDRRRLVEDQNLRAAHEGLENLDLLLHADRNVNDLCLGLDMQVKALGIFLRDFHGLLVVEEEALSRCHAEHHVFRDRQARNEHEVLVHHADPMRDGDGGRSEVQLLPIHPDLAARRLLEAEEHFHKRRFTCAVFAHQRVNFALSQGKIHALVGCDAVGIHFCDPFHLDDQFLVQTAGFLVWHTMRSSCFYVLAQARDCASMRSAAHLRVLSAPQAVWQVKDDNAADGVPGRLASACALVS